MNFVFNLLRIVGGTVGLAILWGIVLSNPNNVAAGDATPTPPPTIEPIFSTTLSGHTSRQTTVVSSVAFSPNGRLLASGSYDNTIRLWNVATGELVSIFEDYTDVLYSVAFSPDGRLLASGGCQQLVENEYCKGIIRLWDVASGELVTTLEGHRWKVSSVVFSPDGHLLASGSGDTTVRLWDVASGELVTVLEGHMWKVSSVAFSPDGRLLASGDEDGITRLWDVASGEQIAVFEGNPGIVWSVVFSPDGHLLASGGCDQLEDQSCGKGYIRLWDVISSEQVVALEGNTNNVTSVAFSPDGRLLASGGCDRLTADFCEGYVRLWDVTSGEQVAILDNNVSIISVAFSPDGRLLASGGYDNVSLWAVGQ